jgi:hypothetical protein
MPALNPADLEALSAYLDNELDPAARADLERRLATEPALRAVVTRLHAAPVLRAPRDFQLDPVVYGRRPAITPVRRAYRWSSAVSALAAVIVLTLGVLGVLNQGQIVPGALTASQSAEREVQSSETTEYSAAAQPSAIALAPTASLTATPQATLSPPGMEQEAPSEADTFAAPALDAANAAGESAGDLAGEPTSEPAGIPDTEPSQNAAAESGFAPAAGGGQDAGLKETPEGVGGGATGMVAPPSAAQPKVTPTVGEALAAQEEAQAPSVAQASSDTQESGAALSAPAGSQPTQDDALGQRMAATPTLEIAAAELAPTPTVEPLPTLSPTESPRPEATLLPAPQPGTPSDEARAREAPPAGIDPALLIGGGLGLLALAGALFALSKR